MSKGVRRKTTGSGVFPIVKGGTGASDKNNALINLEAVDKTYANLPNGVVQLNSMGMVPSSLFASTADAVMLYGPTSFWKGMDAGSGVTITYQITNFDSFTDYVIVAGEGVSVYRDVDDTGIFVLNFAYISNQGETMSGAPVSNSTYNFSINGSTFTVDTLDSARLPTVQYPPNNHEFTGEEGNVFRLTFTPEGLGATTRKYSYSGKGKVKLPTGLCFSFLLRGGSGSDGVTGADATVSFDGAVMTAKGAVNGIAKESTYIVDLDKKYGLTTVVSDPWGGSNATSKPLDIDLFLSQREMTFDIPPTGKLEVFVADQALHNGPASIEIKYAQDGDSSFHSAVKTIPVGAFELDFKLTGLEYGTWYNFIIGGQALRLKSAPYHGPSSLIGTIRPYNDPYSTRGFGASMVAYNTNSDQDFVVCVGSDPTGNYGGRVWRYLIRNSGDISYMDEVGAAIENNDNNSEPVNYNNPKNNKFGFALDVDWQRVLIGSYLRSPWQPWGAFGSPDQHRPSRSGSMLYLDYGEQPVPSGEPETVVLYPESCIERNDGYAVSMLKYNLYLSMAKDMRSFSLWRPGNAVGANVSEVTTYFIPEMGLGEWGNPIAVRNNYVTMFVSTAKLNSPPLNLSGTVNESNIIGTRNASYPNPVIVHIGPNPQSWITTPDVSVGQLPDGYLVLGARAINYEPAAMLLVVKDGVYSFMRAGTTYSPTNSWQFEIMQNLSVDLPVGAKPNGIMAVNSELMALADEDGRLHYLRLTYNNGNQVWQYQHSITTQATKITSLMLLNSEMQGFPTTAVVGCSEYDGGVGAIYVYR